MSILNNISAAKAERLFFVLVVFAHVWPLVNVHFFPTLDGPSHVYNARIFAELLFHSGSDLAPFYELNSAPIPNLTGHFTLAFLQLFLPGWIAEKFLQIVIIAAIPIGFRYLLIKTEAKTLVSVYLIFPFTYSFFFFYGFYNFCLSLALLFFAMGAMEHFHRRSPKIWAPLLFLVIGLVLYFSHLLTFAVFCVYATIKSFHTSRKQGAAVSERRYAFLLFCLAVLPGLVFASIFLLNQDSGAGELDFLSLAETANMYKLVTPAKGILYGKEDKYTQWIFYTIVFMLIYSIFNRLRRKKSEEKLAGIFGVLFIGFFGLSFVVPNQGMLSGGILTSRIVLFALVFLIVFLAKTRMHPIAKGVILFVITYANIACLLIYTDASKREQVIINEVFQTAEQLNKGAVVMPLTSSNFWIREHYSNYLGYEKPLVILENYEAELQYFPLKWTTEGRDIQRAAYADWDEFRLSGTLSRQPANKTDYVFLLRDSQNDSIGLDGGLPLGLRELQSHKEAGVFTFEMLY